MSTDVIVSAAAAAVFANDILTRLNAGAAPGYWRVYTGTQPAAPDVAITTQVLLGTFQCSDPAGSISGRRLTFGAISDDVSVDAAGTATWVRGFDSDGVAVIDMAISLTGGGGALQFNVVVWEALGVAKITSFYIDF